ncbi:MAG: DUF4058 family protein [Gemmataceae bacterium]
MPSPFPGMDPYLENPELWPDVHHELISQIQTALNRVLRPHHVARVQVRTYFSDDAPCQEIKEGRIEIRPHHSDAVDTVIEILSPANKILDTRGRASFMNKRKKVLASESHWVEIDLLRAGDPSTKWLAVAASDYRIVVSRHEDWRRARFWPVDVRQSLPVIGIPLRGKDADVPLDLGAVLRTAYDNAAYDASVEYRRHPEPPLSREDAAWTAKLLREKGVR